MATLLDSYSESNVDTNEKMSSYYTEYFGQSFTSSAGSSDILDSCKFYIKKEDLPTGNAYATIYAHSGTFGTDSIPTGSILATSDALDVSTLTTSYQLITFNFTGVNRILLTANTHYIVVISYTGGDRFKIVRVGADTSSPSAAGNACYNISGGAWAAVSGEDLAFYVYGFLSTIYTMVTLPASFTYTTQSSDDNTVRKMITNVTSYLFTGMASSVNKGWTMVTAPVHYILTAKSSLIWEDVQEVWTALSKSATSTFANASKNTATLTGAVKSAVSQFINILKT